MVEIMERSFYVGKNIKFVKFTFLGHIDITPKFIKAKKNYMYQFKKESLPVTSVYICFEQNKLQGEKNESGTKRLLALLKWINNQETKKHDIYNFDESNVSEEDFLKSL